MEDMAMADMSSPSASSSIMPMMPMMKMYFHFGLGDQLLFSNVIIDSQVKLCSACLILFALALGLEAVKYFRGLKCQCELKYLHRKLSGQTHLHDSSNMAHNNDCTEHRNNQSTLLCCSSNTSNRPTSTYIHCELGLFKHEKRTYRATQATLQFICTSLSLTLMLAAMTYNVCIIFSIVLGKFKLPVYLGGPETSHSLPVPTTTTPFTTILTILFYSILFCSIWIQFYQIQSTAL